MPQRIFVDFMKTDDKRRLLLTTVGTRQDLTKYGIELRDGLVLSVYSDDLDAKGNRDDLIADGIVRFDAEQQRWVLEIDWKAEIRLTVDRSARRPGGLRTRV